MKRNTAWALSVVVGLGAGACGGASAPRNPLEAPLGEIQTAGAPTTIVRVAGAMESEHWINDIAIDGNDLYVTVAWDGVYRLPKYGGGFTTLDVGGHNTEFGELAAGDGAVFWVATSFDGNDFPTTHLRRVATGDTAVSTVYQAQLGTTTSNLGKNLQVDASVVYLTQVRNVTDDGAIHRIPTGGGAELSSILPFMLQGSSPALAISIAWVARNGSVFFADCTADDGTCAIQQARGDGTISALATITGDGSHVLGADATSIYADSFSVLAPPAGGSQQVLLLKIDQQTGAVVELAPNGAGATNLLADDQELFFYVPGASMIAAISKQDGVRRTVVELPPDTHGIRQMAQDDTYLFVLTAESEVLAVPKRPAAQP